MEDFDLGKMSKLITTANGTEYLMLEGNSTWTAYSREQTCVLGNTSIGYVVAILDAKLYPISGEDCNAMITSLEEWTERCQHFLDVYGSRPQWESSVEVKDTKRGIKRMQREITRLSEMEFSE